MVRAVRPLGSLSMARGCARIDSRFDTVKIGSAGRVEVHRARLLAVIGVRKTFPHGLDPNRTSVRDICVVRLGGLSNPAADFPAQHSKVDWFGQKCMGSPVQGFSLGCVVAISGDHDDGNVRSCSFRPGQKL
jgi:hypothetical protein